MNKLLTVYAVDDGYFPINRRKTYTILAIIKTHIYDNHMRTIVFDDLNIEKIMIDSMDVTYKIKELLKLYNPSQHDVLLLDGITYAGFGVVDVKEIKSIVNKIIVFFYRPLDLVKIKKALLANFLDGHIRYNIISKIYNRTFALEINNIVVHVYSTFSMGETKKVLRRTILFSPVPEPLRIAHIVASTLSRKILYK